MAPVKEKQRRSQEESYRRRDTSMSRLLFSCSSRLRRRIEDGPLSCKYLHLVFASALCFVICCAGKMRPCSDDGDKFVQLLLCVTHIPRRPLRPSATRTLRSGERHSRLEGREEGGVSQNPRLPKIPRIPATSV